MTKAKATRKKAVFEPAARLAEEQAAEQAAAQAAAAKKAEKEAKKKERKPKTLADIAERTPHTDVKPDVVRTTHLGKLPQDPRVEAERLKAEEERKEAEAAVLADTASMETAKERALEELGRYAVKTWADYGVTEQRLGEEMTKTETVSIDDTGKHFEEREKGIGVTLAMSLERKRQAIIEAQGLASLSAALSKAMGSVHTTALYLWAKGKAPGPNTQQNLGNQARKAENLAEHLEGLAGQAKTPEEMAKLQKASDQQRERATQLRAGVRVIKEKKEARLPRPCLCGCGKLTKGSFAPGHDSKVHSTVLKIARGQLKGTMPEEVVAYVRNSTWLTNVEMENFLESQTKKEV